MNERRCYKKSEGGKKGEERNICNLERGCQVIRRVKRKQRKGKKWGIWRNSWSEVMKEG